MLYAYLIFSNNLSLKCKTSQFVFNLAFCFSENYKTGVMM